MRKCIKTILVISVCFLSVASAWSKTNIVQADVVSEDVIPEPNRSSYALTKGNINAVIVRLGFKDCPANNSNPLYTVFDDNYFLSLYEGKEEGFGLPYNGLSDYLKTSSYGKLSLSVGTIIDIQMDETMDYYAYEDGHIKLTNWMEFLNKLYRQIDISDFDSNGDGAIDALYVWNLSDDFFDDVKAYTWRTELVDSQLCSGYVCIQDLSQIKTDDGYALNILIHETGHLLFNLYDYYQLGYPQDGRADIGNIMCWVTYGEAGDYDGWSKYIAEWLTPENVINIKLSNGNAGKISLTPYDSATEDGKKIAIFNYDENNYIAVDYCGGINNNNFDTTLRKTGFRFYKIQAGDINDIVHDNNPLLAPEGIYVTPNEELGDYELFSDGDTIEDLLSNEEFKTLKIYDIKTGDNPSFVYSYTNLEQSKDEEIAITDNNNSSQEEQDLSPEKSESSTTNGSPDTNEIDHSLDTNSMNAGAEQKSEGNKVSNIKQDSDKFTSNSFVTSLPIRTQTERKNVSSAVTTVSVDTGDSYSTTAVIIALISATSLGMAIILRKTKRI